MTRTRIALIAVAATLAVAGFVGTAGNSASDRVATHQRLTLPASFRSAPAATCSATSSRRPCRSSAPWGFGGLHAPGALPPGVAVPAAGSAKTDAGTGPTEGVDYSGTNVQEQGVDEPDSVKTNGKTLFAVAGNRLNAVDVTGLAPEAARLAEARQRLEPRAPARRRPPARALARRLLADAAARPDGARAAVLPRQVGALGDRRLEPEGAAARPHAHARRRLRRRAPRRLEPRASSSPRRCRRSCRS